MTNLLPYLLPISSSMLLLCGCSIFGSATYAPLATAIDINLERYAGKWFEIASLPNTFQRGCSCTTAEYIIRPDGVVRVINTCRKEDGTIDRIEGKAFVVEGSSNAKLKVQFFWPFRGDYWILERDEAYSYAVVGVPSRKYLWILSRSTTMQDGQYNQIVGRLQNQGFDTAKLQKTVHTCGGN
jgi:apolipoprotein D and lipocalin family protein